MSATCRASSQICPGHAGQATALHAVTVEVMGEPVIVDLREGTSIALNGTAAAIWRGLVRGQAPTQIARDLAAAFGIEEQRARADVAAFLSTLARRGLVGEGLLDPPGH